MWHYVSPQIQAILGYSPDEWLANPRLWASGCTPTTGDRVIEIEIEHVGGTPNEGAVEYRMLDRKGDLVWIRDDAALVEDSDGVGALARRPLRHQRAEAGRGGVRPQRRPAGCRRASR